MRSGREGKTKERKGRKALMMIREGKDMKGWRYREGRIRKRKIERGMRVKKRKKKERDGGTI